MVSLSNVETILQSIINGTIYTDIPQSRVEALLIELSRKIRDSGGGGTGGGTGGGGFDIRPEDELTNSDINNIMSVISTDND